MVKKLALITTFAITTMAASADASYTTSRDTISRAKVGCSPEPRLDSSSRPIGGPGIKGIKTCGLLLSSARFVPRPY